MLSISLPMHGVGHANYYIELAQKDYYTAQGNDAGVWFGGGAEKLGLRGEVHSQAYERLLWGRSPDGLRDLVQNAGDEQRQTAWDLTFSAPKSVSVIWALGTDDVRAQIEAAHREAVEAALSFLEETTGLTRRGQGGTRMERADLTFALFPHFSSRAFDPQVHTHALLINLAVRRDGTTGALWSQEFFRAKTAAGALFQVQFAASLRERLGVATQPDRIGFQVVGVPKDVCRAFSQRGETIRAILDERNDHDARTAKQVALDTRPHKVNIAREDLTARWRAKAEPLGWNAARVSRLLHKTQGQHCSQKALEQRFQDEAARLPADQRTPGRLRGLAAAVAVEMGADAPMFRPLLRFVPSPQRSPTHRPAGQRAVPVNERGGPHPETPRHEASAPAEAGKVAQAAAHAQPSQPQTAVKAEPTATADQATRTGQSEQPRPPAGSHTANGGRQKTQETTHAGPRAGQSRRSEEPHHPPPEREADQMKTPGQRPAETPRHASAGQTEAGKVPPANAQAQASQPQNATQAEPTDTADRAARSGRTEPPRPETAGRAARDDRQQTQHTAATGPKSGSARQSREHHSQSHGSKSQRQRQRTEQSRAGSKRGPNKEGRRQRQRQNRRGHAQPRPQSRVEQNAELLRQLDPRRATTEGARKKLFFTWKEVMASGKAEELFSSQPFAAPRQQARQNRQFARAFDDRVAPLPAAAQTRQRLTFHATKLAAEHRADAQSLYQTLRHLRPGAERGLVSVEWRRPFPHAPKWSPVRYWKTPVVVLGHAHPKPRKWGSVLWQGSFLAIEARLQQRRLFPKAPQWSPARHLALPALRLRVKPASSVASARPDSTRKKKEKDQGQSQSQ